MVTTERQPSTTIPAALAARLEDERRRADVTGLSIAVVDRDGVRFARGFGYADLARGEPVTPDTLFRAASISKLVTSTLVLREVEAGRLALDEPVNRYLDEPAQVIGHDDQLSNATIRQLLTHTSGLPVSWRAIEMGAVMNVVVNGRKVPRTLEEAVRGQKAIRAPGLRIVYANGAFNLLGYVVQRLNGRPFADLARETVLKPLGMGNSSFDPEPKGRGVATAYGKFFGSGGNRKPAEGLRVWAMPAGALVTSANELARFGRMVLRGGELDGVRMLEPATLDDACRFHARNHPDLDDGYGLGFAMAEYRGRRLVNHDGGLAGVATRIAMLPDEGVGVVALCNGTAPLFVRRVAELLLEHTLDLEPEAVPGQPVGIPAESRKAWLDFTDRVTGAYRLVDFAPPGVVKTFMGLTVKPKLSHIADGILALEGTGFETAFLYPDGELGRYRLALPIANGSRAVIEEKDGVHLWASILHMQKR
jgi:CubicO group peptidase (beta-lactamase class C family)